MSSGFGIKQYESMIVQKVDRYNAKQDVQETHKDIRSQQRKAGECPGSKTETWISPRKQKAKNETSLEGVPNISKQPGQVDLRASPIIEPYISKKTSQQFVKGQRFETLKQESASFLEENGTLRLFSYDAYDGYDSSAVANLFQVGFDSFGAASDRSQQLHVITHNPFTAGINVISTIWFSQCW